MKIKDLTNLNSEELLSKIKQFKKEIFDLNSQRQLGGRVEKSAQFRALRKDIARIMTILNQREREHGNKT